MIVYRTVPADKNESTIRLPENCYILLGSPSSVRAFIGRVKGSLHNGHRLCAIGKTTARAIKDSGYIPYMISDQASFDSMIVELG